MGIDHNASLNSFFLEGVEAACRNQSKNWGVEPSAVTKSYVAGVLADFVRPEAHAALQEALERPLTLVLEEALATPPQERFEKLKGLGDGTLYVSGFFGEHLERRGLDDGFAASIGGFAYRAAGGMIRGKDEGFDLFGELAAKFRALVSIVAEVADSTSLGVRSSAGALRLYERWLRSGSERIGRELSAAGLAPMNFRPGIA